MNLSLGADLFPLTGAILASLTCALLGNFLVLRRQSLMGDAISHSVLPGLVIAYLIASSRSPLAMLLGAAIAGAVTVVLVEAVKRFGRVEPGAAMGVVFSILFALGVLLIRRAGALDTIDLDPDCVLHGQLETLAWYGAPSSLSELFSPATLEAVPRQVWTLLVMAVIAGAFVLGLFKELRIAAFDPSLATTQGFSAGVMHFALMLVVAGATVASFEAVGSILVIAMLVCPGATARLLTDRLSSQIWCSLLIGLATAVIGYLGATMIPGLFGKDALNAAGSMGVVAGVILVITIIASPSQGLFARALRRRVLAREIGRDDLLASLFRARESGVEHRTIAQLEPLFVGRSLPAAIAAARSARLIALEEDRVVLTEQGTQRALELVRKHRLWEHYLVDKAGLAPDHVHAPAELLEHVGPAPSEGPAKDPHGRDIP